MTSQYRAYLLSPEWRERRQRCINRAGNKCESCRFEKRLQAHHLTYERLFRELEADLMCLCMNCHESAERAKEAGKINRIGNPVQLRQQTLNALQGEPDLIRNDVQRMLLLDLVVMSALGKLAYREWKRFLRKRFKDHAQRGKILANGAVLWRRRTELTSVAYRAA